MKQAIYIILFIATLLSCSRATEKREIGEDNVLSASANVELPEGFHIDGDSVVLPEFEIEVDLSPIAEKKLAADKETIIVQAYLSGTPRDSVRSELISEMGEVNLGSPRVEIASPGIAKFSNVRVATKAYSLLADSNFQVLINVFSGRRSSDLNLLDCEILQEPVLTVKSKKHTLKGKLIGE